MHKIKNIIDKRGYFLLDDEQKAIDTYLEVRPELAREHKIKRIAKFWTITAIQVLCVGAFFVTNSAIEWYINKNYTVVELNSDDYSEEEETFYIFYDILGSHTPDPFRYIEKTYKLGNRNLCVVKDIPNTKKLTLKKEISVTDKNSEYSDDINWLIALFEYTCSLPDKEEQYDPNIVEESGGNPLSKAHFFATVANKKLPINLYNRFSASRGYEKREGNPFMPDTEIDVIHDGYAYNFNFNEKRVDLYNTTFNIYSLNNTQVTSKIKTIKEF